GADAAPPRSGPGVPVGRERPDQERTHAPIRHPDGNGVTMSPRAKSSEAEAAPSEETPVRRRGRPRKEQAPAEETAAEEAATTAPKRRGRPPKNRAAEAAASDDGATAAAEAPAAMADEDERAEEAPAEGGGEDRGVRPQERQEERQPEPDAQERRGRNQGRKGALNFRELQSKVLPELHLLAKEVGLEDYRQMEKDELVVAILERATEQEGLRLVRGYLEISSDGYGFLQESLLQNNTRSVIVSAGLIKQFRL